MAVYRSDQAQLTFATEAAQGGDPELNSGTVQASSGATTTLNGAVVAGARSITVGSPTNTFTVGDQIRIGTLAGSIADTVVAYEVRRIELMDGLTYVLDRPLGFAHANGQEVKELQALGADATANDQGKFITWLPGVYETVDTPDPEMSIEGKRFLGTQSKRNWSVAYPGQQTLSGSVSGIVLLNGWPLRFPIGKVVTTPSTITSDTILINQAIGAKKGDIYLTMDGTDVGDIALGELIQIDTGTVKSEVRRVVTEPVTNTFKLNAPLQFDHDDDAVIAQIPDGATFTHVISETVDLDTVSWHVHMKSSDEDADKNFDRRYVGGMIGSATIAAEEGGMVTMGWDTVNFLNMVHNQSRQNTGAGAAGSSALYTATAPSIASNMPRYALMQSIDSDDVGPPAYGNAGTPAANDGSGYPNTQPYYFSQGLVKFWGSEVARLRSFSLSISNGEEPRYYIGRQGNRMRGPYEIKEGPREYTMSATMALPDATIDASATDTNQEGALELFRQLLLEGDYGGANAATARSGFTISLRFDRGTSDNIIIDIPGSTTAGTPTAGTNSLNSQGVFINTAPHNLSTDNPFQVDAEMIFRALKITINDSEPVYP